MKTIILGLSLLSLIFLANCGRYAQSSINTARNDSVRENPSPVPASSDAPKSTGERGTPEEAKAMMAKAVQHYNEAGRLQAIQDFNTKKPPFGDRDLYVACIDSNHKIIANGGYPSLVGTSTDDWKDADGNRLGKSIEDAMSSDGEATIRYRWFNPLSKKIEPKIGFFHRVGSDICGVGAYNP